MAIGKSKTNRIDGTPNNLSLGAEKQDMAEPNRIESDRIQKEKCFGWRGGEQEGRREREREQKLI